MDYDDMIVIVLLVVFVVEYRELNNNAIECDTGSRRLVAHFRPSNSNRKYKRKQITNFQKENVLFYYCFNLD